MIAHNSDTASLCHQMCKPLVHNQASRKAAPSPYTTDFFYRVVAVGILNQLGCVKIKAGLARRCLSPVSFHASQGVKKHSHALTFYENTNLNLDLSLWDRQLVR